jgi:hypothetical protein
MERITSGATLVPWRGAVQSPIQHAVPLTVVNRIEHARYSWCEQKIVCWSLWAVERIKEHSSIFFGEMSGQSRECVCSRYALHQSRTQDEREN